MITKKRARKLTQQGLYKLESERLEDTIDVMIENAAKDGRYSLVITNEHHQVFDYGDAVLKDVLRKYGNEGYSYRIENDLGTKKPTYLKIAWSDKHE